MQERVATPLIITVHAPHCPNPQPNRGPLRSRSLRRTYRSGVAGSRSSVWLPPFTFNVILLMVLLARPSRRVLILSNGAETCRYRRASNPGESAEKLRLTAPYGRGSV